MVGKMLIAASASEAHPSLSERLLQLSRGNVEWGQEVSQRPGSMGL